MSPIRRTRKTRSWGACFSCSACPHIPNTRTCPCGHVLVFPLPLPRFEHQKVPMWARSGARAPPLSLSLVSNTRTSLCVARSGARTPPLSLSLISNTRTSPCGLVLMFAHPFPSRPPEQAHMGSFWCSRTSPLSLPHLEPPLSLSLVYLPF